jgi:hypothetical protein
MNREKKLLIVLICFLIVLTVPLALARIPINPSSGDVLTSVGTADSGTAGTTSSTTPVDSVPVGNVGTSVTKILTYNRLTDGNVFWESDNLGVKQFGMNNEYELYVNINARAGSSGYKGEIGMGNYFTRNILQNDFVENKIYVVFHNGVYLFEFNGCVSDADNCKVKITKVANLVADKVTGWRFNLDADTTLSSGLFGWKNGTNFPVGKETAFEINTVSLRVNAASSDFTGSVWINKKNDSGKRLVFGVMSFNRPEEERLFVVDDSLIRFKLSGCVNKEASCILVVDQMNVSFIKDVTTPTSPPVVTEEAKATPTPPSVGIKIEPKPVAKVESGKTVIYYLRQLNAKLLLNQGNDVQKLKTLARETAGNSVPRGERAMRFVKENNQLIVQYWDEKFGVAGAWVSKKLDDLLAYRIGE